jgi:transglutaminase-like putative cysteine protease
VRQTSHQRLERLDASHPAQGQVDPLGNQVLTFRLESLAPYASRVVTVDARLVLSQHAQALPAPDPALALFTRAERYIESDNPRIRDIARALRANAPMQTAHASYRWVRSALARTGFTPEDRGALRALQDKAGDCTEHAYLLAALLRANGIPARVMGGYLMAESGLVRPHDYHNWVEFHAEGAWRIADAHQGNFERNAARYLATRVMSDVLASPRSAAHPIGASHRYAAAGPGLRVTMN